MQLPGGGTLGAASCKDPKKTQIVPGDNTHDAQELKGWGQGA